MARFDHTGLLLAATREELDALHLSQRSGDRNAVADQTDTATDAAADQTDTATDAAAAAADAADTTPDAVEPDASGQTAAAEPDASGQTAAADATDTVDASKSRPAK